MSEYIESDLTGMILDAAIEVHKIMGPGLLESVYEECLLREFTLRDIKFKRQVGIPLRYKKVNLESRMIIDLIVEDRIIIEIKSVENLLPVHTAQVLTYLKLSEKKVGLLINFNTSKLIDGFRKLAG